MMRVALLGALAATAAAKCPAGCSGHGTCGKGEMCTCEDGFTGLDCGGRLCAYGVSWAIGDEGAGIVPGGRGLGGQHPYTECSSAGDCDRASGTCTCESGFTGKGCRKRTCPNDCSGHGKCLDNYEFRANFTALNGAQFNSQFRDFLATRQCVCEAHWQGQDCSERMCPRGDDPVTNCDTTVGSAAHEQIQRIYVRTAGATTGSDCGAATVGGTPAVNDCTVDSTACVGHFECNHGGGTHQYCSETTRWYANEAVEVGAGVAGSGADAQMDHCAPLVGQYAETTAGYTTVDNTLWGYIALQFTDMFGGVYKTRPILMSNEMADHQFMNSAVDAHSFFEPDSASKRHLQYGGLTGINTLGGNGGAVTGTTGNLLKLAHFDGTGAASNVLYDQIRSSRKLYVADRIRHALQSLPNFAIPSVNVTNYYIDDGTQKTMFTNVFDVTFTHHTNSGRQHLMECIYKHEHACEGAFPRLLNSGNYDDATGTTGSAECGLTGQAGSECNTKYVGDWSHTNVNSCTVEEVHPGTKTYEENAECSNRGTCDTSTGICACYEGHTGEACAEQTVFF